MSTAKKSKLDADVDEPLADVDENERTSREELDNEGWTIACSRSNRKRRAALLFNSKKPDNADSMEISTERKKPAAPHFPPLIKRNDLYGDGKAEMRRIPVPSHRYSPLKENWLKIFEPIVEHLLLQIRFNLRSRNVEIRNTKDTKDGNALQKAADFVRAFTLGFDVADALALIRLDDLFIDSFEVQDVKPLKGDHLARAVGRIAGKGGKTRFTIENVTKTRVVLADHKIHILGSYQNIAIARRAICNLILGSPPSRVYGQLRTIANRASSRF